MSFLHAWAIALGAAALVPFILHLRRRETDRRVAFPALRYLTRAQDARSRSLVASDLLLLAVRIGLVVTLALAAAGPLLGRGGAGDHSPTDLAIIVDNSASTGRPVGGRPLFEELLARARGTLSAARPDDRVWIFPAVGPVVAAGVSTIRAAEALERIELSDGGADLTEVVGRAGSALPADAGRHREVQLLSDLQRTGLRDPAAASSDLDVPLVAYEPAAPVGPNAAVESVQLTGGTTVPSGTGHGVLVRVARPGGGGAADSAAEASIRLQMDGRIAGAARARWGSTATLALPALAPGTHEGRIEVDPEGAHADDVRYFSIHVVPPPAVRFLGPDSSYARVGIETLRGAGRLGVDAPASVTVVEGTPAGGTAAVGRLGEETTLVLIPPPDPVEAPAFNQMLSALDVAWTAEVDPDRGTLALVEPDVAFPLSGIRVRERLLLRPAAGVVSAEDTTILATGDGQPWLVRTSGRAGTVLLLASPFVPRASDLPTQPVVIPFLEALLVQWSHLAGWPPSDFVAGIPIGLPTWARTVTAPDGKSTDVEGGGRYTTPRAGVYRVDGEEPGRGPRQAHFAVNVPSREIDPTPVAAEALEELFPGRPVFTGGPDESDWGDVVFRSRRGRDTAPWLLALALALAAVELTLATPGRTKERAAGADGLEAA